MAAGIDRATFLMQSSRFDMAEHELRQHLMTEPQDATGHALLALCLAEGEQYEPATAEAQQAIGLVPDMPFVHYAMGVVLYKRNRYEEAAAAVAEAIALDPYDADYHALDADILCQQKRWREALESAERGLGIDPEHITCTNLRAVAMTKLGMREEAGRTIDAALRKDPDNPFTHANQGWTLLHQGQHAKAMEHFREALRLDPESEWARQGMLEAMKARYFIYRWMLRYFLWAGSLSNRAQWALILGLFFGSRILRGAARSNPELAPFVAPVLIAYTGFVLLSWLSQPLFNLLLRLSRFGRLLLSRDQVRASNCIGLLLLIAIAVGVGWVNSGFMPLGAVAITAALLLIPTAAIFNCSRGWPRTAMTATTLLLAALGAGAAIAYWLVPGKDSPGVMLLVLLVLGAFASQFIANALMSAEPKR